MKTILRAVIVALALTLTGCATPGAKEVTTETVTVSEADAQAIKKAGLDKIFIKPALYTYENVRFSFSVKSFWEQVTPDPQPKEYLIEFKEKYIGRVFDLLKNSGFSPVKVEKNPGNSVFVEIVIVGSKETFFKRPMALAQLRIYHPLMKSQESPYVGNMGGFRGFMGVGKLSDDSMSQELAHDTVVKLIKTLGEMVTLPNISE